MPSLLKMSAELGLNITPFQARLKKAESAGAAASASIASHFKGLVAGYFGVQALEAALGRVVGRMADIADQADQFSLTTDEVQKMGAAAEEVGLKFEDMGSALLKFNQARKAMNEGDQGKIDAANFFKLGPSAFAGSGKSSSDLMRDVAANLPDKIDERTMNHLAELFGKSGPRLVEALRKFKEENGPIIYKEDIESVDKAESAFRRLTREIVAGAAPAVGELSDAMAKYLKHLREEADMHELEHGKGATGILRRIPILKEFFLGRNIGIDFDKMDAQEAEAAKKLAEKRKRRGDAKHVAAVAAGGAGEIINPAKIAEVQGLQEKLTQATQRYAFGRLSTEGKLGALRKQQSETEADIATLMKFQADGAEQRLDKEKRIAELKLQQLDTLEKIEALQKRGGIDSALQRGIYQSRGLYSGAAVNAPAPAGVTRVALDTRGFDAAVGKFQDLMFGGRFLKLGK